MASVTGTMKYDPAGIANHAAQVGKIGGEVERLLGQLEGLIGALPEVWASGSGVSAATAAQDIRRAGDLVREALAGHALAVNKANALFQDGDQSVASYFQKHV
jgi:WXG100 family type VII secretion target